MQTSVRAPQHASETASFCSHVNSLTVVRCQRVEQAERPKEGGGHELGMQHQSTTTICRGNASRPGFTAHASLLRLHLPESKSHKPPTNIRRKSGCLKSRASSLLSCHSILGVWGGGGEAMQRGNGSSLVPHRIGSSRSRRHGC